MSEQNGSHFSSADFSGRELLVRLSWLLAGHGIMLISSICMVFYETGNGFSPDLIDYIFWGAVLTCLGLRYVDITRFHGFTLATAQPATTADWRRYALILVITAFALWGGAHGIELLTTQ